MYNVKESVVYTNSRGESIRFDAVSIEGLGDIEAIIQQQKAPYQDGTTYIDTVFEPRYIDVEFIVRGNNYSEVRTYREMLASIVNPRLGKGELKYIKGSTVRLIDAVADSVPIFPDKKGRGERWQRGFITFICPNPYWKSTEITEEPAFLPLFEFPSDEYWEEGDDGDMYFEMGLQRDERTIVNDGDAPAPINVIFYGPAESPTIKNLTTGEFIRVNKRLEENEKFIIDTSDDNKSLIYENQYGEQMNVFHWIDLGSTFFDLQIGENEISCMCAISNLSKDFEIFYKKRYVSV